MVDVKIGCRSCGKKCSMDIMKYDPDNRKNLICPECYASKATKLDKGSRVKKALMRMQDKKIAVTGKPSSVRERLEKHISLPSLGSIEYRCNNCNYTFIRRIPLAADSLCPFCGKRNTLRKIVTEHKDWLNEI